MVNASLLCSAPEQSQFAITTGFGMESELQQGGILEAGQKGASEDGWRSRDPKYSELPCPGVTLPTITRSWTYMGAAEDLISRRLDFKRKNSISSIRPQDRSWSLTKTTWSPNPRDDHSSIFELINRLKETKQDLIEVLEAKSPMSSIKRVEDTATVEESEEWKPGVGDPKQLKHQQVQDFKVRPTARGTVSASTPPETSWILLSNLDRVVNPTFSSVIHYYENAVTDQRPFQSITKSLKESLAKTLVKFYALAGRLQLREDGKVDIRCNNKGAIWIEAVVDAHLKDVGGARPNYFLAGLQTARLGDGPIYVPDQLRDMPVLIIQATRFKCGAIAIATSWHHTVADGFSGMHFMRSWSEVALGKPISVEPFHNREILKPRDPLNPTLVTGYSTKSISDERSNGMAVNVSEVTTLGAFNLDATAIADLKRQANLVPPPSNPPSYSSAESISGHLWRQMTKARAAANSYDASLAKDQTTKFFMFVDGRKRLQLPSGYFGNVVCSACAVAKEADILNNPLTYAASMIRSATRSITEEYFRSLIDWVELQGPASSKSEHVNSLGHDVAATFWTFFPMYDIEFGWGKPIYAARNSPPRPLIDGIAMMPSNDGKGMTALLNLHSDRMSRLERQISFTTVFHE